MELYVKIGEGDSESFELVQTKPSSEAMKIMVDYDFISKQLSSPMPQDIFQILNLAWSVTSVRQAMAKYEPAAD